MKNTRILITLLALVCISTFAVDLPVTYPWLAYSGKYRVILLPEVTCPWNGKLQSTDYATNSYWFNELASPPPWYVSKAHTTGASSVTRIQTEGHHEISKRCATGHYNNDEQWTYNTWNGDDNSLTFGIDRANSRWCCGRYKNVVASSSYRIFNEYSARLSMKWFWIPLEADPNNPGKLRPSQTDPTYYTGEEGYTTYWYFGKANDPSPVTNEALVTEAWDYVLDNYQKGAGIDTTTVVSYDVLNVLVSGAPHYINGVITTSNEDQGTVRFAYKIPTAVQQAASSFYVYIDDSTPQWYWGGHIEGRDADINNPQWRYISVGGLDSREKTGIESVTPKYGITDHTVKSPETLSVWIGY